MDSVSDQSSAHAAYLRISDPKLAARPWLVEAGASTSFGQLQQRIMKLTALLASLGVAVGDRVVVASALDGEAAQLFIALICNGVTAVNLDVEAGATRARSLIDQAAPALIFADRDVAARWNLATTTHHVIEIGPSPKKSLFGRNARQANPGGFHELLSALTPVPPPPSIDPETLAYVMFTSGTTANPKGVSISHRALFSHLATLKRRYGYDTDCRVMNTLMLAHADGMIQGPVMGFFAAIPIYRPILFEISSIERLLDAIYQLRITHLIAVPTMLALMLRLGVAQRTAFQGGDFRLLVSCGAQLEAALCTEFESVFQVPLVNVYGLTETVVGGVFAGPDGPSRMAGSIGLPEDCELRIVDPAGEESAEGELLIRGKLLMSGYFAAPQATAEVMVNGWLRTGDVARCDAQGRYWIVGRRKNIIIRGGYNIHPEEITEVLQRHPQVREAVTFGVPDNVWGETVACLIVAAPALGSEQLMTYCAAHLEPRKVPSRLKIVDALPRGVSGKVQIERARELLSDNAAPETVAAPAAADAEERVLSLAAACFRTLRQNLTTSSEPRAVPGWDSLAHLEFIVALEAEFSVQLSPGDIMSLDRLDKAVRLVLRG